MMHISRYCCSNIVIENYAKTNGGSNSKNEKECIWETKTVHTSNNFKTWLLSVYSTILTCYYGKPDIIQFSAILESEYEHFFFFCIPTLSLLRVYVVQSVCNFPKQRSHSLWPRTRDKSVKRRWSLWQVEVDSVSIDIFVSQRQKYCNTRRRQQLDPYVT